MDLKMLEKNITETVTESITKLGFEEVPLTLYFPREALCGLLGEEIGTDLMDAVLNMFAESVSERLGKVTVHMAKDGRYAITVPKEGVRFVYENAKPQDFTESLVKQMEDPDCDIMEIASLFRAHGDAVMQRSKCEDFDYVLYFRDGQPDDYRYCFHEEMGRLIYHRFTKGEFEKFGAI